MKTWPRLLITLFLLSGCSDSTSPREPPSDFRYSTYYLVDEGPILLWEGPDGSKFQVTGGGHMHCGDPKVPGYVDHWETMNWEFLWPDGTIRDSFEALRSYTMFADECELIGSMGLSLRFSGTDSLNNPFSVTTPSRNEVLVGGCLQFKKRIPNGEVVKSFGGYYRVDELFDEIEFPDPMPEVTYKAGEPCWG